MLVSLDRVQEERLTQQLLALNSLSAYTPVELA